MFVETHYERAQGTLTDPWRVAFWPHYDNPYQTLFYRSLSSNGIAATSVPFLRDDMVRQLADKGYAAIHIHWPEDIWRVSGGGRLSKLRGIARLWRTLRAVRETGMRLIWTVHNLEHHEGSDWIDRLGYRELARRADLVICHSQGAVQDVQTKWAPRGEIVLMPMGNYAGHYPPPQPRDQVLSRLGLSVDKKTVCCVGLLRDYKGYELVPPAVAESRGDVQMIIAGPVHANFDVRGLRAAVVQNGNGILIDRALSDQEFADVLGASDVVILPYRKITGSSLILAALTFGRGVIASDLPFFREVVAAEPLAAEFFSPIDSAALSAAIARYFAVPREVRTAAATRLGTHYAWDECVQPVLEVIDWWRSRVAMTV